MKAAIVTGASSGLGASFARRIAEQGTHHLVLVARSELRLRLVADRIEKIWNERGIKTNALVQNLDLTEPNSVFELARAIEGQGWQVDTLVNNAGQCALGLVGDLNPEKARQMIRLHGEAAIGLILEFLPGMKNRGTGIIINVTSRHAFLPTPYLAVYAASKALLLNFSIALSEELRGSGVRVVAYCPGPSDTGVHRDEFHEVPQFFSRRGSPDRRVDRFIDRSGLFKNSRNSRPLFIDRWVDSAAISIARFFSPARAASALAFLLKRHAQR